MESLAIILGTYAITLALTQSEGAFGSFYKLRKIKWVDDFGLLNCHLCTAFWVSLILSLSFGEPLMILIAWGASTMIDKIFTTLLVK